MVMENGEVPSCNSTVPSASRMSVISSSPMFSMAASTYSSGVLSSSELSMISFTISARMSFRASSISSSPSVAASSGSASGGSALKPETAFTFTGSSG